MNEFICKKLNSLTAWIGALGIVLFVLHLKSLLIVLFIALIFMPEATFSEIFNKLGNIIKDKADHHHED